MRKYNGLPPIAVLALTAVMVGCATGASRSGANYPPEEAPPPDAAAAFDSAGSETAPTITPGSVETRLPGATGEAPRLREDAPLRYVVKKGDTLWDIATKFLKDAYQWPEIWYVNNQVRNPHLIYPGDVLTLMQVDGRPQLVATTGVSMDGEPRQGRFSPTVREEALSEAIPAIPMEVISDFLQNNRVVDPSVLRDAPYVVGFMDPQVTAGAGSVAYVKGMTPSKQLAYEVVRLGKKFRDPDTGEALGWEAVPLGDAEVKDFAKISTVNLVRTVREVRSGDQLIEPEAENFDAYFYPRLSPKGVNGRILSVMDGTGQIGQFSIVALNKGAREGVERGDVYAIMQSGRRARDPYVPDRIIELPEVDAGTMMVFKVNQKTSYALVLDSQRVIVTNDRFMTPDAVRRR